jgi:hypothetical protein
MKLKSGKEKLKCIKKKRWLRGVDYSGKKNINSPRTMTKKILRNFSQSKKTVRRAIFQYHVLVKQLKKRNMQKKSDKLKFTRLMSGSIVKKYKLKTETFRLLGMNPRKIYRNALVSLNGSARK